MDSGYYKYHEAAHLLKFSNEKIMLEKAYARYQELKRASLWGAVEKAEEKTEDKTEEKTEE